LLAERTIDDLVLECSADIKFQLKEGPGRESVTSAPRCKINQNVTQKTRPKTDGVLQSHPLATRLARVFSAADLVILLLILFTSRTAASEDTQYALEGAVIISSICGLSINVPLRDCEGPSLQFA